MWCSTEDGGVLTLGGDFSIIRHLEDGTLDASFGGDGRSDAPTPPANFILTAMFEATRQTRRKDRGHRLGGPERRLQPSVRRPRLGTNADGTVDTDFGTDGLALLEATWPSLSCSSNDPNTRLRPNQLVIQPDGKILDRRIPPLVWQHQGGGHAAPARRDVGSSAFGTNGLSNTAGIGGRG